MCFLSIVTPVYNRADLIGNLYLSLRQQEIYEFKWIIVDDCSTDNIEQVVDSFSKDLFDIIFFKNEVQGGKCNALNLAIEKCDSELFLVVDSDDVLISNAISVIKKNWRICSLKDKIVGMVGYRAFSNGTINGNPLPKELEIVSYNELNYHYHYSGETALIFKSEVMKRHKFPTFQLEKFMSEEIQYSKIDSEGKLFLIHESLIVMEYLEDGLTKNYFQLWLKNPLSTKLLLKTKYNSMLYLTKKDELIKKIKTVLQYDVLFLYNKQKFTLAESPNKILTTIFLPVAYVLKLTYFRMD